MQPNNNVDINEVLRQLRAGGNMPEELVEIFSEEAEEHMRSIYDGLDRLRVDSNDMSALSDVRRSSHTLKGAAGAVGFEAITRLSHRMEDLLDWLGDNEQGPTEDQMQLILATADQIEDLTTSEIDFDETAKTMIGIYGRYDVVMQSLKASGATGASGSDAESETEVVTAELQETETKSTSVTEAIELPESEIQEIRSELESSSTISEELAEIFAEEADEHLSAIGTGLTKLIKSPTDKSAMADIRRSSHTLKGAAGAVGMMAMHRLAWRVETLLDGLGENSATTSVEQI